MPSNSLCTAVTIMLLGFLLLGHDASASKIYTYNDAFWQYIAQADTIGDDTAELDESAVLNHIDKYMGLAIQTLEPGAFDYFVSERYVPHAHVFAKKAVAMLGLKRPDLARSYFGDAIRTLNEGISGREKVLRDKASEAQNVAIFLNLASSLAGMSSRRFSRVVSAGLKNFASGANYLSQQYLAASVNLPDVDTTRAVGDTFRMPVVQAGHLAWIGQLITPQGRCTSFQVKRRIVVTNAHCVVSDDGNVYPARDLKIVIHHTRFFKPFWSGEGITTRVNKVVVSDEYMKSHRFSDDWAVLVVEKGLDETHERAAYQPTILRRLASMNPDHVEMRGNRLFVIATNEELNFALGVEEVDGKIWEGARIAIAGYSGDINAGNILMMDYGCPLISTGDVYQYNCSSYPGNSGGPIFAGDFGNSMTKPGNIIRPLTVIGVHACGIVGKLDLTSLVDRSRLFGCGAKAEKFWPTVQKEYQRLSVF